MSDKAIHLKQLHGLLVKALCAHGTKAQNAEPVARALVAAEADGLPGHGLSRLPSYCAQVASGKVDGHAEPELRQVADAVVVVDAKGGFAYPALGLAIEKLAALAPKTGIALAAITRSHHCGAAGYHVEALAKEGLVALMFANITTHFSVMISGSLKRGFRLFHWCFTLLTLSTIFFMTFTF